jgi:uncharacterized glyoxalase superfamily protein PhnB
MKLNFLVPMLEATDLKETIQFYTKTLGFECIDCLPDLANPTWVRFEKDEVTLMFTTRNTESPHPKPELTGTLYFHPDDIDAAWQELKDKVEIEYPLEDFDYGMREFAIRDCNGYLLQFGQETADQ